MNAWFGPDVAVWFSFLSLLSLVAVVEPIAQRGKHRSVVMSVLRAALALGVVLLGFGAAALLLGQPWYVVFPLSFAGAVATVALLGGLHGVRRAYLAAEERRIVARDI